MKVKSLDRKILVVLSLSVAVITAFIIFITNISLRKQVLEEFTYDSKVTMSVIAAGIRQTMASGNSMLIENQLLDIKTENRDMELYIVDTDQRVVFSSEVRTLQKPLREEVKNAELLKSLQGSFASGDMADEIFEEELDGKRFLMHAHLMSNHPQCFRCHGSNKSILGAVVLRKPVDRSYQTMTEITRSNIAISAFGVFAIVLLSHILISQLISRPIRELAREVEELPARITDGTLVESPAVGREDEIGVLQRAFHNMAIDLYEKNHALQKSYTEIANANRELESFAYSVSHDLRAPLRNIDGFSKILMDDFSATLPDRARHYLMRVRNGTSRMSLLIDDILAFSRIGRADLHFRKIAASSIVQSVLENFTEEIERRQIALTLEELPEINCDPVLMQSLFSNLISNAIKYSRSVEHPEVVVGYDKFRRLIYVRDNGVGFDMQYHDKIFQIFQRLHLPEEYEGTGIGLAIVKRIAERHHGRVWAESEPGRGATFYIDLPTF